MMKSLVILTVVVLVASVFSAAVRKDPVELCSTDDCKLEDGCVCASRKSPIDTKKTPQFVVISFDDAVTMDLYTTYFSQILTAARKNPDGSNIKATFFVPHEYTDYQAVHNLFLQGHELGVHSISKFGDAAYWSDASEATLIDEFMGQKEIISQFANLPKEHVKGVRTPFLQLANDTSFTAYKESKLTFDSSWPALSSSKLFPYTLEYKTDAQCLIGTCPEQSYEDMWVSPLNNLKGLGGLGCNVLYGCGMNGTKNDMKEWLHEQFQVTYTDERTPFNMMLNSAWFLNKEGSFEAIQEFIDELLENDNVFFVTESQLIDWAKAPIELEEYKTENLNRATACKPVVCPLTTIDGEMRYMKSCVSCPAVYPWLGNHLGEKK